MNLLNVPGVFAMALGVVGLAYLADGVNGAGYEPVASHPVGQAAVGTMTVVANVGKGLMDMAAVADEMPPADFSDLLRIDEQGYRADFDDSVSRNVMMNHTVHKIEAGRVSSVNIVTTSSGTYSTDSLVSPHVQYPGVEVSELPSANFQVMTWDALLGWLPVRTNGGASVVTYDRTATGGKVHSSGSYTCIRERSFRVCT